ncbi:MAG: flagellar assembly protein FliW [Firmicutes bacterium]|nr:flagellar assembly protein FliW [Bacillota bacterium]
MQINTSRFGQLEVEPNDMIVFPRGILGLEEIKEYVLLGEVDPFGFLQAVHEPDLTFVVIDPRLLVHDYKVEFSNEEVKEIKLEEKGEFALLAIVTIPEDAEKMTANLQAPLLINGTNRLAKQLVLKEGAYALRHPILNAADKTA